MVNVPLIIRNAITKAHLDTLANAVEKEKYLLLVAEVQEKERQVRLLGRGGPMDPP